MEAELEPSNDMEEEETSRTGASEGMSKKSLRKLAAKDRRKTIKQVPPGASINCGLKSPSST
jgi:hypothetical protein